jgi:hypothetical protein
LSPCPKASATCQLFVYWLHLDHVSVR